MEHIFCTILFPSELHPLEKHKIISKKGLQHELWRAMKDCDWPLKRRALAVKHGGVWTESSGEYIFEGSVQGKRHFWRKWIAFVLNTDARICETVFPFQCKWMVLLVLEQGWVLHSLKKQMTLFAITRKKPKHSCGPQMRMNKAADVCVCSCSSEGTYHIDSVWLPLVVKAVQADHVFGGLQGVRVFQ